LHIGKNDLFIFRERSQHEGDENEGKDEDQGSLHDLGSRPLDLVVIIQRQKIVRTSGSLNKTLTCKFHLIDI
jgi:hypothetical protein